MGIFIKAPDYPEYILTGMIAASILFYSFMNFSKRLTDLILFSGFVSGLRNALDLSWFSYLADLGLVSLAAIITLLLALRTFRFTDV